MLELRSRFANIIIRELGVVYTVSYYGDEFIVDSSVKLWKLIFMSVCPTQNNSTPTKQIFMKFDNYVLFENFENIQTSLMSDRNDRYIFVISCLERKCFLRGCCVRMLVTMDRTKSLKRSFYFLYACLYRKKKNI